MTTYLIGSTRLDGWYLHASRIIGDEVTYPQYGPTVDDAQRFTQEERDRLKLPVRGCWIRMAERKFLGVVTSLPDFDTNSESDEVTP
jgi:hypothetical protein